MGLWLSAAAGMNINCRLLRRVQLVVEESVQIPHQLQLLSNARRWLTSGRRSMQMGPDQAANHELWIFFADHDRGGNAVLHESKDKLHLSTVLDALARTSPILDLLICCCRGDPRPSQIQQQFPSPLLLQIKARKYECNKTILYFEFLSPLLLQIKTREMNCKIFLYFKFSADSRIYVSMYLCTMGPAANKLRSSSSSHHHLRIENSVSCSCWSIELHKLFLSSALI
jgi:hypothetical protein